MKKKIGIDARLYSQTGIGVYLKNLLYYLDKRKLGNIFFNIYLLKKDFYSVHFENKNIIKKLTSYSWHSFGEQIGFLNQLLKDNLNLMHFTYFSYPFFYSRKFIVTVHDLTPLLFKTGRASTHTPIIYFFKHFFYKRLLEKQITNSEKIIVPTITVKNQILENYPFIKEKKIKVIYEGVNYQLVKTRPNINLYKNFGQVRFFIYVGNFYPHKNVERLIKAFSQVDSSVKLLLIGPDDFFSKKITNLILSLNQEKRIIHIKNFSFNDLAFFYKNCQALINPSLSEGFGLPLVEAAYFKKPILASNINVFKELWNDQYLAFDPYSVEDMVEKINLFLKKKPIFYYQDILKKFSFKKMTEKTLRIYRHF